MASNWQTVAQRIISGLQIKPGELVQVRCLVDRIDVLEEILLAVELAGATPLLEFVPPAYLERLVAEAGPDYLANRNKYRLGWMQQYDRVLVLQGDAPAFDKLPPQSLAAWRKASHRLGEVEEARRLPFLLVAIPTQAKAAGIGLSLEELEEKSLAALSARPAELQVQIQKVLAKAEGGSEVTINSGDAQQYELRLKLGKRPWLSDDGLIDEADRASGAIVSNLPAGSIYTTVIEDATEGRIWLPRFRHVRDVVLHFEQGRVSEIAAAGDTAELGHWLDGYSGEPRRVSHIGIGLNPYLKEPLDWTLVDEHLQGYLFLALGENRYMGGQNESSLNIDFTIPGVSLKVDGRAIVEAGELI